jgi:hypothetical protein
MEKECDAYQRRKKCLGSQPEYAGYLAAISDTVTSSSFQRKCNPESEDPTLRTFVEELNISTELNGTGLGMISYFGHGATYRTDFNAYGYVTDPAKGYNNTNQVSCHVLQRLWREQRFQ